MFNSDEAAHTEVKRGHAWGSLIFSSNFTESFSKRLDYGPDVDNFAIDASEIEVRMDMSSESKTTSNKFQNPKLVKLNDGLNFIFILCRSTDCLFIVSRPTLWLLNICR